MNVQRTGGKGGFMKRTISLIAVVSLLIGLAGCASMSNTAGGAIIGGASGAILGGVIGHAAGNTAAGAIIGAAIGGAAGAIIGSYMDKQAAEMRRDLEGARIERIGEGIKITFDSGILFDIDKSALRSVSRDNLGKLAKILNKYADTNILIEGHTDSTGPAEHNMVLSKDRAQSVTGYLTGSEVSAARFSTMGYGADQPVATNDTAEGRQSNRRVDVAVMANEKLKKAAQEQAKK
jgi:outer membrane protein OmpA-like peptidoglycan-associated protein